MLLRGYTLAGEMKGMPTARVSRYQSSPVEKCTMAAMSRRTTTEFWILSAQFSQLEVELVQLRPGAWRHSWPGPWPCQVWP